MSPDLQSVFVFFLKKIGTRADANIHKAFARKYLSKKYVHRCRRMDHGYFCLGYFSCSTHLVKGLARKVWRQCVLGFANDLGFRGGNCNGLLANTGLFLSVGNKYRHTLKTSKKRVNSLCNTQVLRDILDCRMLILFLQTSVLPMKGYVVHL